MFYEIEGITRKRITINTLYSNPSRLSKRFPFVESITIKGVQYNNYQHDFPITPWIQQLALEFRSLKELHIRKLVVLDEHLEVLARTRGKDLRSLKISKCERFTVDGLRLVSKYCNRLRTLCLKYSDDVEVNDPIWLRQLASNSTVLERLHVTNMDISNAEDLTLLVKKCCKSLISLKIGSCYFSKLGDAFKYAVRLEHFGGKNRKLKLLFVAMDEECLCLLFKRCPNLEILDIGDVCGDKGFQVIGKFYKKLRKLAHNGLVTRAGHELMTHVGLIALAKGCTKLECLKFMKYLRKLCIHLDIKEGTTYLPLDNEIRAMLLGCSKLKTLEISHGGLTDASLEYIGKYGANLKSLSLTRVGNSDAGLVKLSEGCPNLRKLKLTDCPFSKQIVTNFVFNMPSLRNVKVYNYSGNCFALSLIRPKFLTL